LRSLPLLLYFNSSLCLAFVAWQLPHRFARSFLLANLHLLSFLVNLYEVFKVRHISLFSLPSLALWLCCAFARSGNLAFAFAASLLHYQSLLDCSSFCFALLLATLAILSFAECSCEPSKRYILLAVSVLSLPLALGHLCFGKSLIFSF
jgi:hypothetical protein